MSQLLASTHTEAYSIPLGQRINEIMLEKGAAYTISAMAKRLEMNRETLRLMLKGEREIYTFELEKIAADLKVPIMRILMSDIAEVSREIWERIEQSSEDYERTKQLAESIFDRAIGYTEKGFALSSMAGAYYRLRDYEKALEYYYEALPLGKVISEKFNDTELFIILSVNILTIKVVIRDYLGMKEHLLECDQLNVSDQRTLAIFAHNWARLFEDGEGNIECARQKHYESLQHYLKTNDPQRIAYGYLLVAQFEYRQANFDIASDYFRKGLDLLPTRKFRTFTLNVSRDYASLLIRQGREVEAVEVLQNALELVELGANPFEIAQILYLFAVATQDPSHAETVLNREIGSRSVQKITCQFLIEFYREQGNLQKQAEYEAISKQLPQSPIDMLLHMQSRVSTHHLLIILDHCVFHRWILNDL